MDPNKNILITYLFFKKNPSISDILFIFIKKILNMII